MIEAKVIADSIGPNRFRLTTFLLRYPRFIHCFHPDTEFLSQINDEIPEFRSYNAVLALSAKVAQYHPKTGDVSFVMPDGGIKKHHSGKLVTHKRKTFEFSVTPEHRMFSLRRTTNNQYLPHVDTAGEWVGGYTAHRRIPQAGNLISGERTYDNPDEASLVAFYVADGHLTDGGKAQFHFRKPRKVSRVVRILEKLDIPSVVRVYDQDVVIEFDPPSWVNDCYDSCGNKRYPGFLFHMTKETWQSFRQATLESDGNVDSQDINTTSVEAANQLQVLAFLNESSMNIRSYSGGLFKQKYQDTNYVSFRGDKNEVHEEQYEGSVVCFSVPTSFLCVRYKGYAFVSGNCELMTHRALSRNASSSRAIPTKKLIQAVWNEMAEPVSIGKNKSGMSAEQELDATKKFWARTLWQQLGYVACWVAWLMNKLGAHKQVVNRIIEPWSHITVVATATDWTNFFALRLGKGAQPEFQVLAYKMLQAYLASTPKELQGGEWHLPFSDKFMDEKLTTKDRIKISAARCARTSYLNFDGVFSYEKDFGLHDGLAEEGHMSPMEHQARCLGLGEVPVRKSNLTGWHQYRKEFSQENITDVNLKLLLQKGISYADHSLEAVASPN